MSLSDLAGSPICLESYNGVLCGALAAHETLTDIDTAWAAKCESCVRAYSAECRRELSPDRAILHELMQWREGTLPSMTLPSSVAARTKR